MTISPHKIAGGPAYGDKIPLSVLTNPYSGAVGKYTENKYFQQHKLNKGTGADIQSVVKIEIKTREETSIADHTITSVSISTLLTTDYSDSTLCEKMQYQQRVKWSKLLGIYTDSKLYNFTLPEIQRVLESEYNELVNELEDMRSNGVYPNGETIKTDSLIVEISKAGIAKIRIKNATMKYWETVASVDRVFNLLFED